MTGPESEDDDTNQDETRPASFLQMFLESGRSRRESDRGE